jgi:long-subunit acyl-CoA synthetase (AMP-forming)
MSRRNISLLESCFARHEKRILFHEKGKKILYGRVWGDAAARSKEWARHDIRGRPVVISRPNSSAWLTDAIAGWMCGAEVVPVAARVLDAHAQGIDPVLISSPDALRVIPTAGSASKGHAVSLFTSGTSGDNSRVRFTDENILTNLEQISSVVSEDMINGDDESYAILPWSHCYGLTCELLFLITRGASIHIPSGDIAGAAPTLLFTVPYMMSRILQKTSVATDVSRYSWWNMVGAPLMRRKVFGGRIRSLSVGGARCDPRTLEAFERVFRVPVYQGYGMTEASPMISLNTTSGSRHGSVGRVLPDIGVRIGDDDEILVAGKNVVASLGNDRYAVMGGEKYLRTGDRGRIEDGFLYIEDRLGSKIKLADGLFVHLDRIESIYKDAVSSQDLIVIPTSDMSCLVLVGFEDGTRLTAREMKEIGDRNGLRRHEIPVVFWTLPASKKTELFTEKFTPRRRLLSSFLDAAPHTSPP